MKKTLLFLTLLFTVITTNSQTIIKNNITYTVTSTSPNIVEVSGYNMNGGTDVNIPSSIKVNAAGKSSSKNNSSTTTYSVRAIGNSAFNNKPITNVIIPQSITSIGAQAFSSTKLLSVVLPSSITSININAFSFNSRLSCVTSLNPVPPSLSTIPNGHSFGDSRNTITLVIPAGSLSAYTNPNNGGEWTGFRNGGEPYEVNDTFYYDYIRYKITSTTNNTLSVTGFISGGSSVIDIPAVISDCYNSYSVTKLDPFSLGQQNLTSVTLPNTVKEIGQQALSQNNITNLTLSEGLITIGDYAIQNNPLTSITIPASVTTIGNGAFRKNPPYTVTNVIALGTIPPTLTTGGQNDSFKADRSNISLTIPAGTTTAYMTANWTGFNPITEDGALSISNFEIEKNIKIHTTSFGYKIKINNNINLKSYNIYNISGVKVASGNKKEITTKQLSAGIYILELNFDKGRYSKKFLK